MEECAAKLFNGEQLLGLASYSYVDNFNSVKTQLGCKSIRIELIAWASDAQKTVVIKAAINSER